MSVTRYAHPHVLELALEEPVYERVPCRITFQGITSMSVSESIARKTWEYARPHKESGNLFPPALTGTPTREEPHHDR